MESTARVVHLSTVKLVVIEEKETVLAGNNTSEDHLEKYLTKYSKSSKI